MEATELHGGIKLGFSVIDQLMQNEESLVPSPNDLSQLFHQLIVKPIDVLLIDLLGVLGVWQER